MDGVPPTEAQPRWPPAGSPSSSESPTSSDAVTAIGRPPPSFQEEEIRYSPSSARWSPPPPPLPSLPTQAWPRRRPRRLPPPPGIPATPPLRFSRPTCPRPCPPAARRPQAPPSRPPSFRWLPVRRTCAQMARGRAGTRTTRTARASPAMASPTVACVRGTGRTAGRPRTLALAPPSASLRGAVSR